ncbi:MAG: 2-C-methyl-D-erythritol 4-phosphate cytidylyltransferase [Lachnospiraceae bacterium]|nr:2-C-methyl-D-erythritol 4-phosphate cytidylyltransferase [Lachnospiraceae bacterium]
MKNIGIILAGGSGSRMGGAVPKQYMEISGHPLIWYALNAFEASNIIEGIVLVAGAQDVERVRREIVEAHSFKKVCGIACGGSERYFSVANALHYIEDEGLIEGDGYIFVQDGARPFVDEEMLERLYNDVRECGACVAAVPSKDTVKIADEEGFVKETPDRSRVWNIQTPQVFEYKLIRDAYFKFEDEADKLISEGINITDDASLCELYTDKKVKLTLGSYENIKITTPEDVGIAQRIIEKRI